MIGASDYLGAHQCWSLIPIFSSAAAFRLSREPTRRRAPHSRRPPIFWAFALLRISVAAIAFLLPAVNFFFTIFSSLLFQFVDRVLWARNTWEHDQVRGQTDRQRLGHLPRGSLRRGIPDAASRHECSRQEKATAQSQRRCSSIKFDARG